MGDTALTWLAIRASGVTAWGLLTAVVVWGILLRTRILGRAASPTRLLDLHRWLGALALSFLAIHMVLLLFDSYLTFSIPQILIPGLSPWNTFAVSLGVIAFWFLIPVSIVGRLRPKLKNSGAKLFQQAQWLADAAWPIATMHYILAGTDALAQWSIALLIAGSGLIVLGLMARGFIPSPGPTRAAGSVVIRS